MKVSLLLEGDLEEMEEHPVFQLHVYFDPFSSDTYRTIEKKLQWSNTETVT